MAVYRIIEDFDDASYSLIAIHCILEDYRLCYFLNRHLQIKLERLEDSFELNEKASFVVYEWYDTFKDVRWNVLVNKSLTKINSKEEGNLFETSTSVSDIFLVEEYKQVDFFLKIDDENKNVMIDDVVNKIKEINQIITAYTVNTDHLKIKNQLNFFNNA